MSEKKGKSPYVRKQKVPHRYSELYQRWEAARRAGNNALAESLGRQHTAHYMGE